MRELLPGWVPPNEDLLEEYWEKGLFAVDANVLLGLYRRPKEARGQLIEALQDLGDRLWVPHQAAMDYLRNRLKVLMQQRTAKTQLSAAFDEIEARAQNDLQQLLQRMSRREIEPLESSFKKAFKKLRTEVVEVEERNLASLGESIRIDPLLDEVESLCADKVGDPFPPARLNEVHSEAQRRIDSQQPPGYEDAEKPVPQRYGDYVLWEQLCAKANDIDQPLLLITDDLKEDWVWRENGQMIGPRPELVAEMQERCGVPFHLYSSTQFLALATGEETEKGADSETEPPKEAATPLKNLPYIEPPDILRFGEAPTLKPNLGQARPNPPVPLHRPTNSGVLLGLSRRPGGMFSKVRCAVVDPTGSATAAMISSGGLSSVSLIGVPPVKAIYPRDFPGATLMPGLHQVVWYRVDDHGYIQMGPIGEREIARDSFIIAPHEAGDELE
jgi:hypothetical protein